MPKLMPHTGRLSCKLKGLVIDKLSNYKNKA